LPEEECRDGEHGQAEHGKDDVLGAFRRLDGGGAKGDVEDLASPGPEEAEQGGGGHHDPERGGFGKPAIRERRGEQEVEDQESAVDAKDGDESDPVAKQHENAAEDGGEEEREDGDRSAHAESGNDGEERATRADERVATTGRLRALLAEL